MKFSHCYISSKTWEEKRDEILASINNETLRDTVRNYVQTNNRCKSILKDKGTDIECDLRNIMDDKKINIIGRSKIIRWFENTLPTFFHTTDIFFSNVPIAFGRVSESNVKKVRNTNIIYGILETDSRDDVIVDIWLYKTKTDMEKERLPKTGQTVKMTPFKSVPTEDMCGCTLYTASKVNATNGVVINWEVLTETNAPLLYKHKDTIAEKCVEWFAYVVSKRRPRLCA